MPSSLNSFDLDSKGIPTSQQLQNFERETSIALLALAANSGQTRFAATNLLHPHVSTETQEMAINSLKEEIESNLKPIHLGTIVEKFQAAFDKNRLLLGCASCGIREFQMGKVNYEGVNFEALDLLRLSDEQVNTFKQIPLPFNQCVSVYQVRLHISGT